MKRLPHVSRIRPDNVFQRFYFVDRNRPCVRISHSQHKATVRRALRSAMLPPTRHTARMPPRSHVEIPTPQDAKVFEVRTTRWGGLRGGSDRPSGLLAGGFGPESWATDGVPGWAVPSFLGGMCRWGECDALALRSGPSRYGPPGSARAHKLHRYAATAASSDPKFGPAGRGFLKVSSALPS